MRVMGVMGVMGVKKVPLYRHPLCADGVKVALWHYGYHDSNDTTRSL